MIQATAVILVHNEKENILRTLAAVSSINSIVLVDTFSTDETIEIAKRARPDVQILQRRFDSHAQQWNFGLDHVTTEWVLALDADYELSPQLQAEIARLNPPEAVVGYSAEFVYRILGHSLRASGYPPRIVLFRVKKACHVDDGHTQTLWFYSAAQELRTPAQTRGIEKLGSKIYHDDRKPLSHWIRAQDRYARLEAKHLLAESGKRKAENENVEAALSIQDRLRLRIFFAAPVMFLYLLFARGLILDGWPVIFYVAQRTVAELLLSIRLLIERESLEVELRK